jgi:hypothetical protein
MLRHGYAVRRIESERRFGIGGVQRILVSLQDSGDTGFVGIHRRALAVNDAEVARMAACQERD